MISISPCRRLPPAIVIAMLISRAAIGDHPPLYASPALVDAGDLVAGPISGRWPDRWKRGSAGGAVCGDAILDAGESCDDGGAVDGDGCSSLCQIEPGADCTFPEPAVPAVVNGSFEQDLPPWRSGAGAGGDLILVADNIDPFGDIGQVGTHYVIFFGTDGIADTASLTQDLVIPTGATTLSFEFFGASASASGCDGDSGSDNAVFRVIIDGTDEVFDSGDTIANECESTGPLWAFPQAIDITAYADDATHTIRFERQLIGPVTARTNFFLDAVRIDADIEGARPSRCFFGVCGDAILSAGESCDDGNATAGDGCSAACSVETSYSCSGGDTALGCLTGGDCAAAIFFQTDEVRDGGLEAGRLNPDWTRSGDCAGCILPASDPLCSEAVCGVDRAADGAWYAWFGGIPFDPAVSGPHLQTLSQSLSIGSSATTLSFELDTQCSSADDVLTIAIDADPPLLTLACNQSLLQYTEHTVDISAYADGGVHTVTFHGVNRCTAFATDPSCQSNFFVDNVHIHRPPPRSAIGSSCQPLDQVCDTAPGSGSFGGIESFEDGIPAGWQVFNTGTISNDWTTSDDPDYGDGAGCGGEAANWPGGNIIGSDGQAACADSNGAVEALGPDIGSDGIPDCGTGVPGEPGPDCQLRSYLCTPLVDPFAMTGASLTFDFNYQTARQDMSSDGAAAEEAFQILVGSAAPDATTIAGYEVAASMLDHKSASLAITASELRVLDLVALIDPTTRATPFSEPFYLCFAYAGVYSWYAQIDNVALRAQDCEVSDADFDGVPDDVDDCFGTTDWSATDADGDGIPDSNDNCSCVSNPDQDDANGDHIGNACDADVAGPDGPGDCIINFLDLNRFRAGFFSADPELDLTGPDATPDGVVNFLDLSVVKSGFFGMPGPSAAGCN